MIGAFIIVAIEGGAVGGVGGGGARVRGSAGTGAGLEVGGGDNAFARALADHNATRNAPTKPRSGAEQGAVEIWRAERERLHGRIAEGRAEEGGGRGWGLRGAGATGASAAVASAAAAAAAGAAAAAEASSAADPISTSNNDTRALAAAHEQCAVTTLFANSATVVFRRYWDSSDDVEQGAFETALAAEACVPGGLWAAAMGRGEDEIEGEDGGGDTASSKESGDALSKQGSSGDGAPRVAYVRGRCVAAMGQGSGLLFFLASASAIEGGGAIGQEIELTEALGALVAGINAHCEHTEKSEKVGKAGGAGPSALRKHFAKACLGVDEMISTGFLEDDDISRVIRFAKLKSVA